MLPTELLNFKIEAGLVKPRRLKPTPGNLQLAETLLALFEEHLGERRRTLTERLVELEAGRADHRVMRGLAHLLTQAATFETRSPMPPEWVRERVFSLAQLGVPSRHRRAEVLAQVARTLDPPVTPEELADSLYADLASEQTMTAFDPPTPDALLARYDLAQAQGVLYRAYNLIVTARRNEPARYKQLFKYIKLFGLMASVEGDADHGFTLTLDGPASLFGASTRYGLSMAKFLPALLHVTKWDLTATLRPRRDLAWAGNEEEWRFELTSEDAYVSHYAEPQAFDSALELSFADRFGKLKGPWTLEREVDLVSVPGGVIIPDFRLLHEDGRSALLEIVGYWRPDYLRKKFRLLRQSGREDVIVAVSERLNLERAGVDPAEFGGRVVFFKGALNPKAVLELAEGLAA